MNDDPLREALRSLPRQRAGEGFTRRVLERIDSTPPARHGGAVLRWAAAAGVAGLLITGALSLPGPETNRRQHLRELEAERARLASELDELKRLAGTDDSVDPVIYLGGDDRIDLVLDVGRLARQGTAVPAGYHPVPDH
jgi:hypothetical protein